QGRLQIAGKLVAPGYQLDPILFLIFFFFMLQIGISLPEAIENRVHLHLRLPGRNALAQPSAHFEETRLRAGKPLTRSEGNPEIGVCEELGYAECARHNTDYRV